MAKGLFGRWGVLALALAAAVPWGRLDAAPMVRVTGFGAEKKTVSIHVANPAFAHSLRRNLELSGLFKVTSDGQIKVTAEPDGSLRVAGAGRALASRPAMGNDFQARQAARSLSDAMCQNYGNQKGFAGDPIAFVRRAGKGCAELCSCYPDGYDIRQLTQGGAVVGPRWKDRATLFYTNLKAGPEIWELEAATGRSRLRWNFRGLTTGAAVAPDGRHVAIILSFQGNPELYVIDMATSRWKRLTETRTASEGQPAWSPDGRQIVYVSDETRHPQLYVIDVATKARRRLTSHGVQNLDPDWGPDGRIAYVTKRGGQNQVAVLDPAKGDSSAQLVTEPGPWEHPSWARDNRHLTAGRDKAIFILDTMPKELGGDAPQQVFRASGTWITPSWSR